MYYCGMDVSDKSSTICIMDEGGEILQRGTVANDPDGIRHFFMGKERMQIGMEACGISASLAKEIGKYGHEVKVLHPEVPYGRIIRGKAIFMNSADIVMRLWDMFNKRDFSEVRPLLDENFVCEWPQSKELIRGADNFIALNENYPGEWKIECKRIICNGNEAVSEVLLTCGEQIVYATSFFEIENDKIVKMTEYWGEPYDAPEWRKRWVEKSTSR